MNGIKMNELHEVISHCHEVEFEHSGTTYVLQPEVNKNKIYFVIWDCTPDAVKCIAEHEIECVGVYRRPLLMQLFQKNVLIVKHSWKLKN